MPELAVQQTQVSKNQVTRAAEQSFEKAGPVYSINPITSYQQAFGNQTVQRMLQAKVVQAKLVVNPPNDEYEREADQVADAVMRMPEPAVQRACPLCKEDEVVQTASLAARITPLVQRQAVPEEDEEEAVQTKQGATLQRQEEEPKEEEPLQTKALSIHAVSEIQREVEDEDEEEQIQTKLLSSGNGFLIQRAETEKEEEEDKECDKSHTCPKIGEKALVQRKKIPNASGLFADSIIHNLGQGRPLDPDTRDFFELRFGYDFSRIQMHTDGEAAKAAQMVRARAYTLGSHIVFGSGEYAPSTGKGKRLLAHELTHVVQQGATPSTSQITRHVSTPAVQRADYSQYEGAHYLDLLIPFGDKEIYHELELDNDIIPYFDENSDLAQNIEDELGRIFNPLPPARPLHETAAYMESPAIHQQIVRGVRRLSTSGHTNFTELSDLLRGRTDLFYEQNLLPAATRHLAAALGIADTTIDWNALIPDLRTEAAQFEPTSVIDASLRDRYDMFLDMLANEASSLQPVIGAAAIDAATADYELFAYVTNAGAALFSKDVFDYHSEKFVEEYLPLLEQIRYVPEEFDLEAFRPARDTRRIDEARERIISNFLKHEAESRVVMYILDRWTVSGRGPEEFLGTLDLEEFRNDITAHLAEELINQAISDPDLMGALRSRSTDEARFTQVGFIVGMGRHLEAHNRSLSETFLVTTLDELTAEDRAIAADPWAYYNTSLAVSGALSDLLSHLTPDGPIELQALQASTAILSALDIPAGYAPLFLLPELLGYLAALQRALEEQERETQRALEERLDLDFERIAVVVQAYVEHADRYVRETWIPMLKEVAIDFATQNRDELKYQDENWEAIRSYRILEFAQGAAELEFMADELQSGRAEEVEVEGEMVGRDGIPHLRNAARMMRAAGLNLLDEDIQSDNRDKLRGAVADYDQVIEDINDGTYDPLDYSRAVYEEARRRLDLEGFEAATVGMVLSRRVVARKNPFLEYAIVRWRFKEGLERNFRRAAVLFGLGILTLAAALVPGAVGIALGALDIAVGVGTGVQGVLDARATLRMARLDIRGTIVGVSEADAEAALNHACIGLAVTIVITSGVGALQARAYLRRPGGVRIPRSGRAAGITRAEERLLGETGRLHGSQMSPQQLNAEAQIASRRPAGPSKLAGFEEEILLPNAHTWRRRGSTWCRFSTRPFCMPDATLPTAMRRRAYRDVARTLDEGVDASGRIVRNRGHSFVDHGAQTTPAQHQRRLTTGVTPSGRVGPAPARSSKFSTHRAQLDAYQMALDDLGANYLRTRGTPKAEYGTTLSLRGVGKSYTLGPGGVLQETTVDRFFFHFERNAFGWYDLITMYPVP